jgi:3-hydroxyanthranilate 3,4-dioxygenase
MSAMQTLDVVNLNEITAELAASGKRVKVLWQQPGSLAFVARGREYRSEFHVNDSDEVTYMIKGTMRLHYRTAEGKEEVAVIPEGATNFMPAGTPHSPRFPPDAFALILERGRRPGEIDRFTKDPVSLAYKRFFDSVEARTCKACGTVMPAP